MSAPLSYFPYITFDLGKIQKTLLFHPINYCLKTSHMGLEVVLLNLLSQNPLHTMFNACHAIAVGLYS